MQQQTDSGERTCSREAEEHIKHIFAGYTALATSGCTNSHSVVAGYIHWKIRKQLDLQVKENSHVHISERVINIKSTSIMWYVLVIKWAR